MQKEQQPRAESNQRSLSAGHHLVVAESTLVTAETAYEKGRIETRPAASTILEGYGISVAGAQNKTVEASHR